MGFSLADVGLAAQGYDQAEMRRQAVNGAREDHDWQMQQRRQLADQQHRELAYQQELRDTMSQYLAGGAQGVPGSPQTTVQVAPPVANDDNGTAMPTVPKVTAAKPADDNMPGLYKAMASVQAKYGKAGEFEDTRKRLKKFQDEGVLDFISKAKQGAPDDELLDSFNKSGAVKLADLKRVGDGSYVGTTADGKPVGLDVKAMTESLLSPKDLLAHQDKTELAGERLKAVQTRTDAQKSIQDAKDRAQADVRDARAEALRSRAGYDDARADGTVSTGRGAGRTAGNWNQYDAQVRQLATVHLTAPDPDTGKPALDRKNLVSLTSMASQLARQHPEISPAEAVSAAVDKIDELKSVQEGAMGQAEEEAKTLKFDSPRKRDAWVAGRAKGLTGMRNAPATPASAIAPKTSSGDESAGTFKNADDVKAAYQAGKLTREQAKAALQQYGFK